VFSFRHRRRALLPALVLALALGACAGDSTMQTFELLSPRDFGDVRGKGGSLAVALPTTIRVLDTERVVIQPNVGEVNYLGGARWSDRVPRLVQARIIEAFENSKRLRAVTRDNETLRTEFRLDTEIREFGVVVAPTQQAVVELSVKLLRGGRVVAAQVFTGRAEASSVDGPAATAAINSAFGTVLIDLVRWAAPRV
jgi:cholesterol transport system auxiliary component